MNKINEQRKQQRKEKREKAYQFIKKYYAQKLKKPTLREIGEHLGCSKQNAQYIYEELKNEGKLVEFMFYDSQSVDLPHEWIESTLDK
ncbi:MAG: hypothetical protein ACOC5T_07605 [Elusimicrobiota bacterium]